MTIYKIRSWSWRTNRKGEMVDQDSNEDVVIDNLDFAQSIYKSHLNRVKYSAQFSKYHGRCQLFIPHIHEDGLLAYFPDNDEYIEEFAFDNWSLTTYDYCGTIIL